MKSQVNITSNNWTQEIVQALRYVYKNHSNPGYPKPGCTLTLERDGAVVTSINGLAKLDKTVQESLDTNLVALYNDNIGQQIRVTLLSTDKIYLTEE